MSWSDVVRIVMTAIASVGGIGVIIVWIIKFLANKIAERISKNFQETLDEKLEKYKSELSKKEYVSKTKFDTEFILCRELSSAFAEMVKCVCILIPSGLTKVPSDKKERLNYEKKCYESACPAFIKAQDTLNANIPFITEDIYEGYKELLGLAHMQLNEYTQRFVVTDLRPQSEKESFSDKAYARTEELTQKWIKLNQKIREYISTLDVMGED